MTSFGFSRAMSAFKSALVSSMRKLVSCLGTPLWPWPRPHAGPLHYEVRGWTTFEEFRGHALDALRALRIDDLDEAAPPAAGRSC